MEGADQGLPGDGVRVRRVLVTQSCPSPGFFPTEGLNLRLLDCTQMRYHPWCGLQKGMKTLSGHDRVCCILMGSEL